MAKTTHTSPSLTDAVGAALAEFLGVPTSEVTVAVGDAIAADKGPYTVSIAGADVPAAPDRSSGGRSTTQGSTEGGGASAGKKRAGTHEEVSPEELDEEADAAADFLEGLLDALDLPGDLRIRIHEEYAEVEIADVGTGALIGRRGQTLDAIQELVRCTLQRQFERRTHVQIDAESYRARRLERLLEKAEEAVSQARESGEEVKLEPMDVFERKAIHRYVADCEGVESRSFGREPGRRVVVLPTE